MIKRLKQWKKDRIKGFSQRLQGLAREKNSQWTLSRKDTRKKYKSQNHSKKWKRTQDILLGSRANGVNLLRGKGKQPKDNKLRLCTAHTTRTMQDNHYWLQAHKRDRERDRGRLWRVLLNCKCVCVGKRIAYPCIIYGQTDQQLARSQAPPADPGCGKGPLKSRILWLVLITNLCGMVKCLSTWPTAQAQQIHIWTGNNHAAGRKGYI